MLLRLLYLIKSASQFYRKTKKIHLFSDTIASKTLMIFAGLFNYTPALKQ